MDENLESQQTKNSSFEPLFTSCVHELVQSELKLVTISILSFYALQFENNSLCVNASTWGIYLKPEISCNVFSFTYASFQIDYLARNVYFFNTTFNFTNSIWFIPWFNVASYYFRYRCFDNYLRLLPWSLPGNQWPLCLLGCQSSKQSAYKLSCTGKQKYQVTPWIHNTFSTDDVADRTLRKQNVQCITMRLMMPQVSKPYCCKKRDNYSTLIQRIKFRITYRQPHSLGKEGIADVHRVQPPSTISIS